MKVEKIVIFDADGTLWKFKNKVKVKKRNINEAKLNIGILKLLKNLREKNISCKVLSYQEGDKIKNKKILIKWLKHFKIKDYFDEMIISNKYKHIEINEIIKSNKIKKNNCFYIGDKYKWDYLESRKSGVKCFLLNTQENRINYKIKLNTIEDIINYFNKR